LLTFASIGLISHKKQSSSADFIMGNRSLNFWLTALSAHASDMSAWLFMGFPAAIFIGGLSQSWIAIGLILGMLLNWQFIAKKLRTSTEHYDSYTLPTFFEKRFKDNTKVIRILTAIISIFFLASYVAAGLIAMGLLLESVFGVDYYLGLTVATSVVVAYTFAGGFVTVAWTDLFQALFLLVVIVLVTLIGFAHLPNGLETITSQAHLKNIGLSFFQDDSFDSILTALFLVFGWGLGYFGQPHIITKFMGIKDAKDMYKSKYIGMSWQIISLSAAACIGLIGIGFFQEGLPNPQLVYVEMVKQLFSPLMSGFILCAFLAANMSTMDSQILVCASILSEDFYKPILNKKASDHELLRISRASVVLISAAALLLAFGKSSTVLEAVEYAWAGLGSAFGPLVLVSLYSKNVNKYGAMAGILTGGIISGIWQHINPLLTSYTLPPMLPGFFVSLASIYLVSALTHSALPRK
jgi:sodium/proline symporter